MQVLKNGEICPKMNDPELWKDIFPQIKEDDWETVEQHLNKKQDNFVVKLRQDYPLLSEEDIHIIVLLRLEVSHEKIARQFHVLLASFRTRMYRIKKKMRVEDEYHLTEFIRRLYV